MALSFVGTWIIPLVFRVRGITKIPMHTVHDRYTGVRGTRHNMFVARVWIPRHYCELHLGTFTSREGAAEVVDQGRIYMVSLRVIAVLGVQGERYEE